MSRDLKPSPPLRQESGRVKHGQAVVTWSGRMYGPPTIVANAPVGAIDDLVAAVALAQEQLRSGDTEKDQRQ